MAKVSLNAPRVRHQAEAGHFARLTGDPVLTPQTWRGALDLILAAYTEGTEQQRAWAAYNLRVMALVADEGVDRLSAEEKEIEVASVNAMKAEAERQTNQPG